MRTKEFEGIGKQYGTPAFVFDTDAFAQQAEWIDGVLGEQISLCYSIKANPFLLAALPSCIKNVEVCSPGELTICERLGITPDSIIYSGVNKGMEDITRALRYGVGIVTAESKTHVRMVQEAAKQLGCGPVSMILRLSNGNQFGMDEKDLKQIIASRAQYDALDIIGVHYYTGTQKKKADQVNKEIIGLTTFLEQLEQELGYAVSHVEYGPGLAVEYFNAPFAEKDRQLLAEVADALHTLGSKYHLTVEMGRFLASSCGYYLTSVADLKNNGGTAYVICDGGINHLKYYGQTMAMQVPKITVVAGEEQQSCAAEPGQTYGYTLCGSLCTTADLLVRKAELPELHLGDLLVFHRCGAYTVTEGIGLFLSRALPAVVLYSEANGARQVRAPYHTDSWNTPGLEV